MHMRRRRGMLDLMLSMRRAALVMVCTVDVTLDELAG
jgi:hypothetical protein